MSTPPPIPTSPAPNAPVDAPRSPVPNYMVWSIVATILGFCTCCFGVIPGIVAIVFSSKVNGALDRGDYAEATRASANAKLWCWITTGLIILGVIANIVFVATGGMAQYMDFVSQMQASQG